MVVALSRAKRGLFIFGNKKNLQVAMKRDDVSWSRIIRKIQRKKRVIHNVNSLNCILD